MNDYDFEKIDREMEGEIARELGYVWEYDRWWIDHEHEDMQPLSPDWSPKIELLDTKPPEFELVPIGIYNGVDLPGTTVLNDNYIVWLKVPNPEYDCEVAWQQE